MVARTPPKQRRIVAPLNPVLIRETLKKVDQCMARLQELQYTVAGGNKVISGVSLSPRSTRGYLRTSLRCKQESIRIKSTTPKKSPGGKLPASVVGEWKRMSLPAMLVGETLGEILQASQFAKEIVEAVACNTKKEDPKTPVTRPRKQRPYLENTELKSKRKKEKQNQLQSIRLESSVSPSLQRARSRINFKVVSPPKKRDLEKDNTAKYLANRVSPRNRPWVKKAVLFPNPLFLSADSNQQQKFCRTRSPIISRTKQITTPHKFLIKSPPPSASKFQVKIKNPLMVSVSPTKVTNLSKKTSPNKLATASKLRRSFSPSRLVNRLVSPLKSRKNSVQKSDSLMMSGLKQRPVIVPRRFSLGRI
ncbi:probable microtubule-binding protein TANGLED [Mercurialis annua]|uniref:probable microtubule-binding protein TANGLED n=1 Tax=Mercurialis annua TaxID=3986 RepID=UPI0021608EE3|nr:probable microtubule-binding protein TANGLED [Mercurialis annua]